MPAGPLVDNYSVQLDTSQKRSVYGEYALVARVNVKWKECAPTVLADRKALLGESQQAIDIYHSQAAFSADWLLLNELRRKHLRAKLVLDRVMDDASKTSKLWDELMIELFESELAAMEWDPIYAHNYAKQHATSSVIPGSFGYRSRKWSQLSDEEFRHLFELCKSWLEWLLADFEKNRYQINKAGTIGRGIRARSPDIDKMTDAYTFEIDRARQVQFAPDKSAWFAFIKDDKKQRLYELIRDRASSILGTEVLLPPLLKGQYWAQVADYLDEGHAFVNGDGAQWEFQASVITGTYCLAVDDGIPQEMSGVANTALNNTIAMLRHTEVRVPNIGRMAAVGVMGDDELLIGDQSQVAQVKSIPNIWEIDDLASKHRVILGMCILPERKGTFPGLYRLTVDRGDQRIPIKLGQRIENIKSGMSPENQAVYNEIMSKGTLNGEPLITRIAKIQDVQFYEGWAKRFGERYQYLSNVGEEFSAYPDEEITVEEL